MALVLIGWLVVGSAWYTPPGQATTTAMSQQRVGWCHDYVAVDDFLAPSDVRGPVPCSQPHVAETIAIDSLPDSIARLPDRPTARALVRVARRLDCAGRVGEYVGADERNHFAFIETKVRFPTVAEWALGERRYRCDIVPSARAADGRPTRIGSLRNIMRQPASAAFRRCLTDGRVTSCIGPHEAEIVFAPGPVAFSACSVQATTYVGESLRRQGLRATLKRASGLAGRAACMVSASSGQDLTGTLAVQATGARR